jgi:hypothetical protein
MLLKIWDYVAAAGEEIANVATTTIVRSPDKMRFANPGLDFRKPIQTPADSKRKPARASLVVPNQSWDFGRPRKIPANPS